MDVPDDIYYERTVIDGKTYYGENLTLYYCKKFSLLLHEKHNDFLDPSKKDESSIKILAKAFRDAICVTSQRFEGLIPSKEKESLRELLNRCEKIYLEAGFK